MNFLSRVWLLLAFLPVLVSGQITPPYTVSFENAESFTNSSLHGQNGWQVISGAAAVTNSAAFDGTNAVVLSGGTPAPSIAQSFSSFSGGAIVFVDFYAQLAAGASIGSASIFNVESSFAGLVKVGTEGEVYVSDGDGLGAGTWKPTGFLVPLTTGDLSADWIRFTLRLNFTGKTWDLFLDGGLVSYDLGFRDNTKTYLSTFNLTGDTATNGFLDYLYVWTDNPLFTDLDKDGMEDSWETTHGLNTALIDRDSDFDGDGLKNIDEYRLGTSPALTDSDGDGLTDNAEVYLGTNPAVVDNYMPALPVAGSRLYLRADAGLVIDNSGYLTQWKDMSGTGYDANQTTLANKPQVIANQLNGRPVIRFDGGDTLGLPNFMSGATSGEMFAVVKVSSYGSRHNGLWTFGNSGSVYINDASGLYEDFGRTTLTILGSPLISPASFYLHNVSASSTGWGVRLNGLTQYQIDGSNVVGFATAPVIGAGSGQSLQGDIAEIVVYDRVLTSAEREAMGSYFQLKYQFPGIPIPSAPTDFIATALSSNQVSLAWVAPSAGYSSKYVIERQIDGGSFVEIATVANDMGYMDTGLEAGEVYGYRVKVQTYGGISGYSSTATAQTFTDGDSLPTDGMRLWLSADAGTNGVGPLNIWRDQSPGSGAAVQAGLTAQPQIIANQLNGRPVVRFDGGDTLGLPNFMSGATSGEMFAVVKVSSYGSRHNGLWTFGNSGSVYINDASGLYEDFGRTTLTILGSPLISPASFYLHNVSASSTGWAVRLNGLTQYQVNGSNAVGFAASPVIGAGSGQSLEGDVAEIIVYDRVLTSEEREAVGSYFQLKYQLPNVPVPSVPTGFVATVLSSSQVSLSWAAPVGAYYSKYLIERQIDGGPFIQIATVANSLGYIDTGLEPGEMYGYRVRLLTYAGISGYSSTATAEVFTEGDSLPLSGMRLWLRADAGTNGVGPLNIWRDQSVTGAIAVQNAITGQPQIVANQLNGRPVVRFDGTDALALPDFMNGATSGDMFAVVRAPAYGTRHDGLWKFGNGGATYINGTGLYEDFGRTTLTMVGPPLVSPDVFYLHNVSASSTEWSVRLNGLTQYRIDGVNTVGFSTTPVIGAGSGQSLQGDIAEIIIYDRVLTPAEREAVGSYFQLKYQLPNIPIPVAPTGFVVTALSSSQVSLAWVAPVGAYYSKYLIERQVDGGSFAQIATAVTSLGYIDDGLEPGKNYGYRIKAQIYGSTSEYSATATVQTFLGGNGLPTDGMRLWLSADAGTNGVGPLNIWRDQSPGSVTAVQTGLTGQPQLIVNQLNGRPVVRFDGGDTLDLPNFMSGATSGEMFAVVKVSTYGARHNGLWKFGNSGSVYINDASGLYEDFGRTTLTILGSPLISPASFYLHNVSASSTGWAVRLNGLTQYEISGGNTVGFTTAPVIGAGSGQSLEGDVAEIIVYDRVLTSEEREAVRLYLYLKYGLGSLGDMVHYTDLNGDGVMDKLGMGLGISPFNFDSDGDGVRNDVELLQGTDPLVADTDGDGVSDALDAFPLDLTRSTALVSVPGDVIAPSLLLVQPADAILIP